MKEKSILILTPLLKVRKSFLPIILILACLTFQFFFIKFHYNNALSQPKDNITENVQEVKATVVSKVSIVSEKLYQSLKINDEIIIINVEQELTFNETIPVWSYNLDLGKDPIEELIGSESNNTFYSLTKFSFQTGNYIDGFSLTALAIVSFVTLFLFYNSELFLIYLKSNNFVNDMRFAYSKNYFFRREVDYLEAGLLRINILVSLLSTLLILGPSAYVAHLYFSGPIINFGGWCIITFSVLCASVLSTLLNFLLEEEQITAKLFIKYCWLGNFTKVPVNEIPLHDKHVKEKLTSWVENNKLDYEVVKALVPTFNGNLKDLKEVATVLASDAK